MSKVAIVKCGDYSPQNVASSVAQIFELLNLSGLIRPGQKVLLKANLLTNLPPERGATTHPAVVKAIADEVKKLGASPFICDSPGGANLLYAKVLKETGMQALGIPIVNFEEKGMRKFENPGGKINPIYISNTALSFDLIINIPKLKTHELTLLTCGIKNMFGCVPGLHKVNYHLEAPTREEFSEALVDLFEKIRPVVTIADAVTAMEGQGPSNGKLRELGLIIASTDTIALDAVCSKIMCFEPLDIPTTRIAYRRKLGEADIEKIDILGEKLPEYKDFEHPTKVSAMLNKMPAAFKFLLKPIINMIKVRPKINGKKCVKCMMCVRSCPAKAIDGKSFKINKNKCIMCFCCRELCKYNAVDLKESLLWKILSGTKKTPM
jgi:uncharacterized protein (DUF362 family)/Pyruvate/2-oxoacid:ferredoxin oxidoreductase delta subunit